MTQFAFPVLDPNVVNGTQLAGYLNSLMPSLWTQHAGAARPTYLEAGGLWVDTTTAGKYVLKGYAGGTASPTLGTFDATGWAPMAARYSFDATSWIELSGGGQVNIALGSAAKLGVKATGIDVYGVVANTKPFSDLGGGVFQNTMVAATHGGGIFYLDAIANATFSGFRMLTNTSAIPTVYEFRNTGTAYAPVSWGISSDERLKTDIAPIDAAEAWDKVADLEPCSFRRTDLGEEAEGGQARTRVGFISQRVRKVRPEAVDEHPMGERLLGLDPVAILAQAVAALIGAKAEIEALQARIAALEGETKP